MDIKIKITRKINKINNIISKLGNEKAGGISQKEMLLCFKLEVCKGKLEDELMLEELYTRKWVQNG